MKQRLEYMDSLRGVAILLVILFHAYARWPKLVPYGESYNQIIFFKFGWLGVNLFFLISGFVIMMTLEKYKSIGEFLTHRWLRLFPAMIFCSILIYSTSSFFFERPLGQPILKNLVPGLTFIEPYWWEKLFHLHFDSLEGAFWSLYVEFKFYLFAGIIYYWKGKNWLISFLIVASISAFLSSYYNSLFLFREIYKLSSFFSFNYFGWFAAGITFYIYVKTKQIKWFYFGLILSVLNSITSANFQVEVFVFSLIISAIFAITVISPWLQNLISNKFLLIFGFISYPLYLIHENMMISLIRKMNLHYIDIPGAILPIVAILFISGLAYFIAAYVEPYLTRQLKRLIYGLSIRKMLIYKTQPVLDAQKPYTEPQLFKPGNKPKDVREIV